MNITNDVLEPDSFYHIYNRGINSCNIFQNESNYRYFLNQFLKYVNDYVEVYAYCLMPNHFHFLIKVKSKEVQETFVKVLSFDKGNHSSGLHSSGNIVSKQIGKFISRYSQSFNKVSNRHGPLLESPFKRIRVANDDYLKNLIVYIHLNPTSINVDYVNYKFLSYLALLSHSKTNIMRDEVISIFEDLDNFTYCHKFPPKFDFKF